MLLPSIIWILSCLLAPSKNIRFFFKIVRYRDTIHCSTQILISDYAEDLTTDVQQSNMELTSRIVGGTVARMGQVPSAGSLQVIERINVYTMRLNHICGTSLISPNWCITAGHCIYQRVASSLRVRFGSLTMFDGGILCEIKEIIEHPQYDRDSIDYDFAVLRLLRSVIFIINQIWPIKLPYKEYEAGTMCSVAGWGTTQNNSESSSYLRIADISINKQSDCIAAYKNEFFSDRMLCAGPFEGGRDGK